MTEITYVPLDRLEKADTNIRTREYDAAGVRRLAEQIHEKGLFHPLLTAAPTSKSKKARIGVTAGGRRLAALNLLASENRLPEALAGKGIPTIARTDSRAEQLETSLLENFEREQLTPIEELNAFRSVKAEGFEPNEIARRFGVSEKLVKQRLALANVHPELLAMFEQDQIGLAEMNALANEPKQERQKHVFDSLPSWSRNASSIRRALNENALPITDRYVKLATVEEYESRGGEVKRDLFDDNATVLTNVDLVHEICAERLQAAADEQASAGWKWVDTMLVLDHEALSAFRHIHQQVPTLTEEDQAKADKLAERLEELEANLFDLRSAARDAAADEAEAAQKAVDDAEAEWQAVSDEYDDLAGARYLPEDIATAGIIAYVDYDGGIAIREGLVRPEDAQTEAGGGSTPAEEAKSTDNLQLSNAFATDLDTALESAIQGELRSNEQVAFLISTAMLASAVFKRYAHNTAFHSISALQPTRSTQFDVPVADGWDEEFAAWSDDLDVDASELITTLSEWKPEKVRRLHTFCAAMLYSRERIRFGSSKPAQDHATVRELISFNPKTAVSMDEAFFKRCTKPQIVAVIGANDEKAQYSKANGKGELVKAGQQIAAETSWVPAMIERDDAFGRLLPEAPSPDDAEPSGSNS